MKILNSPLISVIVPCFNSGRTIKRTILSIKKQTWVKKEIILVNDGSTDGLTINTLKELGQDKIHCSQHENIYSAGCNIHYVEVGKY